MQMKDHVGAVRPEVAQTLGQHLPEVGQVDPADRGERGVPGVGRAAQGMARPPHGQVRRFELIHAPLGRVSDVVPDSHARPPGPIGWRDHRRATARCPTRQPLDRRPHPPPAEPAPVLAYVPWTRTVPIILLKGVPGQMGNRATNSDGRERILADGRMLLPLTLQHRSADRRARTLACRWREIRASQAKGPQGGIGHGELADRALQDRWTISYARIGASAGPAR